MRATGAVNTPQFVTVSLTILQPILSLSAGSDDFTVTAGGAAVTRTVIVANNSGEGNRASLGAISCGSPSDAHVTNCTVNQATGQISITVNPTTAPALTAGQKFTITVPIVATNMGNTTPPTITLVVTVQ